MEAKSPLKSKTMLFSLLLFAAGCLQQFTTAIPDVIAVEYQGYVLAVVAALVAALRAVTGQPLGKGGE